jgi:hypothetical protein
MARDELGPVRLSQLRRSARVHGFVEAGFRNWPVSWGSPLRSPGLGPAM